MHLLFSNFFSTENRAVHEKMWKKTVEQNRPQMIIWLMRIACWIPKSANTHLEYAILLLLHCNSGCTNCVLFEV
jgi:hypothetical protein